jgi:hypothetical protein
MPKDLHEMSGAALHSAGAVVRHASPFATLEVPQVFELPPQPFIDRWVKPFYMACLSQLSELEAPLALVRADVDEPLVTSLLSYFNWRPRIVGGVFAAVWRVASLEEHIGRLLLRSDVCFSGAAYCHALVRLNTPRAARFLREYLEYYLTRTDLWFNQMDALAALRLLDEANLTQHAAELEPIWAEFAKTKPNWNLTQHECWFRIQAETLRQLATRLGAG